MRIGSDSTAAGAPQNNRLALPCAVLFLGLAVLTHLDQLLLGPYGFVDFYDTIEVHFSHFKNLAGLLWEFGFFSWYPFHGGGVPAFVGQHPPYNPAVFFSAFLPYWLLALFWAIGLTAIAGWGMTRLLRQLCGLSTEASLLFGTLFSLMFINCNIHIVFAYAFPAFAIWTMEAFDTSFSRKERLYRCLGLFFVSLISFPVLTLPHFPVFHFFMILFLARHRKDFIRQVLAVFIVWTGYVLLFAPSIISLYQFIPWAQRDWNFPSVTILQATISFFKAFKGRLVELAVFPLLLPSLYVLRKRKTGYVALLFVLVPLVVSCIFGSELKNFLANTFIVKMDLFLSSMLAGCASFIFVGLGFDALKKDPGTKFICLGLALASVFLRKGEYALLSGLYTVLATMSLFELTELGRKTLLRQAVLFSMLAASLSGIGMMTRQQYMAAGSYFPQAAFDRHSILKEIAAESKNDPFRVGCIDIHPAVVQAYGLDTVGGKSPLFNKFYKEYLQLVVAPQLSTPELQEGFAGVWRQMYLTRTQADHDQRPLILPGPERSTKDFNLPLLERLGVRYFISARPMRDTEHVADLVAMDNVDIPVPLFLKNTAVGRSFDQPFWIYRLRNAQPLGSLAAPVSLPKGQSALQALHTTSPDAPAHSVYLEPADSSKTWSDTFQASKRGASPATSQVKLVSWAPDRLVFEGSAPSPALLVVSNNFAPNWSAKCNGSAVDVFRANHAFQAVPVLKAGPFTVELEYHAPLIWWAHLASLAGCLLLLTCLVPKPSRVGMLPAPVKHSNPALQFPVHCVLAGSGMAIVWSLGFSLFVMRKISPDSGHALTMSYAMLTIPLLGPCIGGWTAYFLRRICAASVTSLTNPCNNTQN